MVAFQAVCIRDGNVGPPRHDRSSAPQTITTDKKAANILAADMVLGRKVLLDTGDHNDPADFVIYAVWA